MSANDKERVGVLDQFDESSFPSRQQNINQLTTTQLNGKFLISPFTFDIATCLK